VSESAPPPVLVTGAAGFVGARFVWSCAARGIPVIPVDARRHFDERTEHRGIPYGPIIDREDLFGWLEREHPTLRAIVHLGACTDTRQLDVAYLTRVNLEYSRAIWRYAAETRVPLVYASSAATYGDGALGYEDDEARIPQLRPLNPYGDSKQQFDLWALGEERAGRHPPAWCGFKFFNVYGFGERHKGPMASVVLHAFDQIRATGRVRLFRSHRPDIAHGHQARDFIAVEDVLRTLHFALDHAVPRGIFNLGTGAARSYLDVARAAFAALGADEHIEFIDTPPAIRDRYQYFTQATTTKLRAAGFTRPFTLLEDGIRDYLRRLDAAVD
jgi:ADP-L-glycero-D-manno-heptose 6-epimerase